MVVILKTSNKKFPDKKEYKGYLVEVSLPKNYSGKIGKAISKQSEDMNNRIGKDNQYICLTQSETFEILENLNLDPFRPELPLLFILDKHPSEVEEKDELVMLKLGNLEGKRDLNMVLDEIVHLMVEDKFLENSTNDERKDMLLERFEEIPEVSVTVVSSLIFN